MVTADACTVALDGDGKVVGLEMAGARKVLAVSARKARTMTAKKWQQVARDFLGATPGPTAILKLNPIALNPITSSYMFIVKAVTYSKRRGEGKVLAFETQQMRSQARQNGPGLGDSPRRPPPTIAQKGEEQHEEGLVDRYSFAFNNED